MPPEIAAIARHESAWADIRRRYDEVYGPPGSIVTEIEKNRREIEKGVNYEKLEDLKNEYSIFHAESLLVEARELLEHSVVMRREWQDLRISEFELNEDIREFIKNDEIHQEEVLRGFYELDRRRAGAQRAAASLLHQYYGNAAKIFDWMHKRAHGDWKFRRYLQGLLAYMSANPVTEEENKRNAQSYTRKDEKGTLRSYVKRQWMEILSQSLTRILAKTAIADIDAQLQSFTAQTKSSEVLAASHRKDEEWAEKDVEFRKRRTRAARDLMDLRVLEASRKNGILNYPEMRKSLEMRFERNFRVAVALAERSAEGLRQFYGISIDLPPRGGEGYLDRLLLWTIDATHQLARFQRRERSYARTVSIKLKGENTVASAATGRWRFVIAEDGFRHQRHVRLRGISAHVVGDTTGVWELRVKTPEEGIPEVTIGRVQRRSAPREPDIVGMNALRNINPIGTWELEVSENSTADEHRSLLDAVELDLHVAVIAAPS